MTGEKNPQMPNHILGIGGFGTTGRTQVLQQDREPDGLEALIHESKWQFMSLFGVWLIADCRHSSPELNLANISDLDIYWWSGRVLIG